MIKVEFTKNTKENLPKYPYIGISKVGMVVLFISPTTGLCLSNPIHPSGHWPEDAFVYYQGEITISNT
jgi:hypothetical protein